MEPWNLVVGGWWLGLLNCKFSNCIFIYIFGVNHLGRIQYYNYLQFYHFNGLGKDVLMVYFITIIFLVRITWTGYNIIITFSFIILMVWERMH